MCILVTTVCLRGMLAAWWLTTVFCRWHVNTVVVLKSPRTLVFSHWDWDLLQQITVTAMWNVHPCFNRRLVCLDEHYTWAESVTSETVTLDRECLWTEDCGFCVHCALRVCESWLWKSHESMVQPYWCPNPWTIVLACWVKWALLEDRSNRILGQDSSPHSDNSAIWTQGPMN